MPTLANEIGFCECGCGQPTPLAKRDRPYLGHVRGKPLRFLPGHQAKLPEAREAKQGINAGPNSGTWKGGKTFTSRGYALIKLPPDHPFSAMCGRNGYVYEHRLVLAMHLRRLLDPEEVVHHINGNVADNRIENLMLFANNGDHMGHHKDLRNARMAPKAREWKRCPHHHTSLDARRQCEARLNRAA